MKEYDEIIFLGWSLGKQDEIYMDEILSFISEGTVLKVVCYDDTAIKKYKEYFQSEDLSVENIRYFLWSDIENVLK